MTAEAILWMNDGDELANVSAVLDASAPMNVVEADNSLIAVLINWSVVDENALASKSSAAVVEDSAAVVEESPSTCTTRSAKDCVALPTEAVRPESDDWADCAPD